MSQRRCLHSLARHSSSLFSSSVRTTPHLDITISTPLHRAFHYLTTTIRRENVHFRSNVRCFSSGDSKDGVNGEHSDDDEEDSEDDDDDEEDGEIEDVDDDESVSKCASKRVYSPEEKAKEAAEIGYEVVGPLQRSDRVYKDYEPAFAVVQIGSHQFKVSNGDCIYTERLKFCEVNDKLILNKVLLLGTSTQTVVGRPTLPEAAVHAVVEEHALDAKVIIFKKKRRKNYRRTKGHRQELTKLRITSVEGIEIPQKVVSEKPEKTSSAKSEKVYAKKPEKVPVTA